MKDYKQLKAKSKVIVRKKKVVDREEIKEITDEKQNIIRKHQPEESHMELQIVSKRFDPMTGEELGDNVQQIKIESIENQLENKKQEKLKVDGEVSDLQLLLDDLNKVNNVGGEKNG